MGVAGRKDEEEISGRAGGSSKLDGRLEEDMDEDDEDELDEDDGECRFTITPESLSLVKDSLSRSDAKDAEEISSAD